MSTKIHVACDAQGKPLQLAVTPGQAHDLEGADRFLENLQAPVVIADKAYDADARMRNVLRRQGKIAVIPFKCHRSQPGSFDKDVYKHRHHIENFFAKLKQYRAIATRYDKTAQNFLAALYLVAAGIN